jgi:hypothetical protein
MRLSRHRIGIIAALTLSTTLAPTAGAVDESVFGYETVKDLVEVCRLDQDAARLSCRAFLEATVQYHDAVVDNKGVKRLICYPQGTTIEQAREVFLAWAEQNASQTERMGELPVVGVVRSLAATYPCR